MKNIRTLTLSKSEVEKIDSSYVRGVDKLRRMYAGIASNLEKYEKDIIYLRIENTERKFPSDYGTALKIVKSWLGFNKELRNAKGFTVSFYSTKSTGFVLNHEDIKDEDKIKQVVKELKSSREHKSELINIFSGFLWYNKDMDNREEIEIVALKKEMDEVGEKNMSKEKKHKEFMQRMWSDKSIERRKTVEKIGKSVIAVLALIGLLTLLGLDIWK